MADPSNGILQRFLGIERRLDRHDQSLQRLYDRTDDLPADRARMLAIAEDVKEARDEIRALRRLLIAFMSTTAVSAIVFAASVIATRVG